MSKKEKFPLYLSPEKKAILERRYQEDGSRSITAFIERAVDFYLDYLSANSAGLFLPTSVQSYLDGRLDQFENRMASLLFKQAVELDMGMSTLADCVKLDEEYLRRRRANSIANVKRPTAGCGSSRSQKTPTGVMMSGKTDCQESLHQVRRRSRRRRLHEVYCHAGTGGDHSR